MATELVVGCPVRRREWIIDTWFDHVEMATAEQGWRPTYAFVADRNDPTVSVIADRCANQDREVHFAHVDDEDVDQPDERRWNPGRFERMVELRNRLLGLVRELGPRYFLSLDSDILLHPQAISDLIAALVRFDAVGGATYMTPTGTQFPSCGWYRGMEGLVRRPMETAGLISVGVIMAIKLMSPVAYAVDYEVNPQGEDIGWSLACEKRGVRLGWDNHHWSRHVMAPADLDRVDQRCG